MAKKQQEVVEELGKLGQVIIRTKIRENGTLRRQQDFSNCPTLCEQHTAHLTDLNYLIKRYKPDELAAYMAARDTYRQEIIGHDFSKEPNFQEGMNHVYQLKKSYSELPEEIRSQFKNHVEFLKFIDNPANQEKMIKLKIFSEDQIKKLTSDPAAPPTAPDPSLSPTKPTL